MIQVNHTHVLEVTISNQDGMTEPFDFSSFTGGLIKTVAEEPVYFGFHISETQTGEFFDLYRTDLDTLAEERVLMPLPFEHWIPLPEELRSAKWVKIAAMSDANTVSPPSNNELIQLMLKS